jgi:putative acetyltransferase
MSMEIKQATTNTQITYASALFREYFDWLEETHGLDLSYQGIEDELASLPGVYAPPRGRLLLAYDGDVPVACGALKPQDEGICELKRTYVRPAYRGKGLGRQIAKALLAEARKMGYQRARVDTATFMYAAQALYRSLGFYEVEVYTDLPEEIKKHTMFMEVKLEEEGTNRV